MKVYLVFNIYQIAYDRLTLKVCHGYTLNCQSSDMYIDN